MPDAVFVLIIKKLQGVPKLAERSCFGSMSRTEGLLPFFFNIDLIFPAYLVEI